MQIFQTTKFSCIFVSVPIPIWLSAAMPPITRGKKREQRRGRKPDDDPLPFLMKQKRTQDCPAGLRFREGESPKRKKSRKVEK